MASTINAKYFRGRTLGGNFDSLYKSEAYTGAYGNLQRYRMLCPESSMVVDDESGKHRFNLAEKISEDVEKLRQKRSR